MLGGEYFENRFKKGGLKSILGMEVQREGERRRQRERQKEGERGERERESQIMDMRKGKLDRRDYVCFGI